VRFDFKMSQLSQLTYAILISLVLGVVASPQVINIRHPESVGAPQRGEPTRGHTGSSPSWRARFTAKPGNVIVHFDKYHEIQHIQYVLQDGGLATLYQRHQAADDLPTQVQPSPHAQPRVATLGVHEPFERKQRVNHDETIEILDSKMNGVSHLVGDHITIELPDHRLHEGQVHPMGIAATGPDYHEKLDVLATVAADAIQTGAQVGEIKLKKAGVLLDKLKNKVSLKLHELPSMIEAKLRSKSSMGRIFLDEQAQQQVVVQIDGPGEASVQPVSAHPSTKQAASTMDQVHIGSPFYKQPLELVPPARRHESGLRPMASSSQDLSQSQP